MPGKGKGGGGNPGGGGGGVSLSGKKNKADTFVGTDYGDILLGNDGNDILIGNGNDQDDEVDFLNGGNDDDILIGDSGSVDEFGNVTLIETSADGNDRLFGGSGNDRLYGGAGDDELQGGSGDDFLDGGSGMDVAYYMETPDAGIIVTGFVDGTLVDNRRYVIDFIGEGANEDALNIEGIAATNFNDQMYGGSFDDWFDGADGDDVIEGNGGDDDINGGGGNDTIDGGDGNDNLYGASGDDTFTTGSGNDFVDGGENAWWEPDDHDIVSYDAEGTALGSGISVVGAFYPDADPNSTVLHYVQEVLIGGDMDVLWRVEEIVGTSHVDTMIGHDDGGDDGFSGEGGADILNGKAGNDTIDGGAGNDSITGGLGNDVLTGGADADTFFYASVADGGDKITDFSGASGEGDSIDLTALGLVGDPIGDGVLFFVDDLTEGVKRLYVDLDGGGFGETTNMIGPDADDVLIATFTDGGAGFTLNDVLV